MEYLYTKISIMTNIKIFGWDCETDEISCYGVLAEQSNPLILSEELRELLKNRIMNQKTPVIYQDENKVIFCGMREKMTKMLLLGPICIEDMSYVEIHRYCKAYQIENEQCPPKLKLQNLLALLELLSYIKIEEKYEDEEILDANGLIEKQEIGLEADVRIDTEDIYHHTYQEEVKTMDYIREGNLEEVVGAVELLASTAGKLSENEIRNERNLGICSITLATRAAIEGGAAPAKAYKLSDLYINKIDQCKRMTEIFEYRKRSLYDFAKLVVEEREKRANSKTERAYCRQKKRQPVLAEDDGIWLLRSCSFACADQPDHAGSIFFGGREPCVIKAAEIRRYRSDEQRVYGGAGILYIRSVCLSRSLDQAESAVRSSDRETGAERRLSRKGQVSDAGDLRAGSRTCQGKYQRDECICSAAPGSEYQCDDRSERGVCDAGLSAERRAGAGSGQGYERDPEAA